MNTEAISVSMSELETAWTKKHDAGEDFKTLCEAVAVKAQCEPSVLKTYISARMQDKLDAQAKKAEQLGFLFDNLGA